MDKIISGVEEFQRSAYVKNSKLFETLAGGQQPEVLLITCADSRIDPNLITQTQPGDLFICRNAGNIIPAHSPATGGMTASIEYAIAVLNIPHIVICGHTDCGAMKAAMNPSAVAELPHVAAWLSHCSAALAKVKARHEHVGDEHLMEMIEENVLLQMKHVETHPAVAAKLATKRVEIHGWVYDIAQGAVTCYDASLEKFVPIKDRYASKLSTGKPRMKGVAAGI